MKGLQELFTISSGYTFRDTIADMPVGRVGIIQAGDINAGRLGVIVRVDFPSDRHLLRSGDIVLSARGGAMAHVVSADLLPAMAASSVFVLRPTSPHVNTRYIAMYLNSTRGQEELRKITSGAYIKTLRKADLAQVYVPEPLGHVQARLVALQGTLHAHRAQLQRKQQLLQCIEDAIINTVKEA